MSSPAISELACNVIYVVTPAELSALSLNGSVSSLPEYSDSFFSVKNLGERWFVTRMEKEDVTPPLNQKIIWCWEKVSTLSLYDTGPKEGQSAREDLKGLKISVTPMADLFDRRGGVMYEVFAQKIE
jgi:hypothetical protein